MRLTAAVEMVLRGRRERALVFRHRLSRAPVWAAIVAVDLILLEHGRNVGVQKQIARGVHDLFHPDLVGDLLMNPRSETTRRQR